VPKQPPEIDYWSVPRCWPGECVAILAGGKTLTQEDVDHVRGKCRVIAINRAGLNGYRVGASWADWLWACDADRFWAWHPEAVEFPGEKIVVRPAGNVTSMPAKWPMLAQLAGLGVKVLRHTGRDYPNPVPRHEGASPDPAVVRGSCSLFQILSVIAHTGVSTVLLMGADMRGGHFHGGYFGHGEPNYADSVEPLFRTLVEPLEKAGILVLNCCPSSIIRWWPKVRLRDVL
jgi:hypothetical protein